MARIRIKIDKMGNPTILTVCGEGTNCQEATKNFEKALGKAQEETRALTDNYYETYDEENVLTHKAEADG